MNERNLNPLGETKELSGSASHTRIVAPKSSKAISHDTKLVSIFKGRDKIILSTLIGIWAMSLILFLQFWFNNTHIIDGWRFLVNSLLLAYSMLLPGYFFFFFYKLNELKQTLLCLPTGVLL
jgi:hypothetical protein